MDVVLLFPDYYCNKAARRGAETCNTGWLAAGVIEDAIMEQLRGVFASPEIVARTWLRVVLVQPTTITSPSERPAFPRGIEEGAQESVVIALARAYRWKELLETGRFRTITALAKAFRVDGSYVGRILRLTLLAPDIQEALIKGTEPEGLSFRKLTKTFPMDWEEQRYHLGFTEYY